MFGVFALATFKYSFMEGLLQRDRQDAGFTHLPAGAAVGCQAAAEPAARPLRPSERRAGHTRDSPGAGGRGAGGVPTPAA